MYLACFHQFFLHGDSKYWALCLIPGVHKIFFVYDGQFLLKSRRNLVIKSLKYAFLSKMTAKPDFFLIQI